MAGFARIMIITANANTRYLMDKKNPQLPLLDGSLHIHIQEIVPALIKTTLTNLQREKMTKIRGSGQVYSLSF